MPYTITPLHIPIVIIIHHYYHTEFTHEKTVKGRLAIQWMNTVETLNPQGYLD